MGFVKTLAKNLKDRYHYSWVVLNELVKTDFKLRYQGSFLGIAWSVIKPLMLFGIMYMVFVRFLHFTDGTPQYPVVLLMGNCLWQFFAEATGTGLRSIVDRGDILRKIHFPNYVIVVSATCGALISLGINLVVILMFAILNGAQFTWRVLLLPFNLIELYIFALGCALLLSTIYVHFRDILHIWEVISQIIFYATPIIYPLSMVKNNYPIISKIMLLSPIAQTFQDARHNLVDPHNVQTIWNEVNNPLICLIPYALSVIFLILGVYVFRKHSRKFAEIM
ncbi:ABC-2 type transport system permease protein [Bifidobacterium commune]|uniref:Transport permease protein n=1 Tax=Bifidobacterium commune TaxID=1505727 RepID=A0A1C4H769_9BIFI|nr:ABC transporter permease [Bifidobacterium commune]SCC80571.1 ABC-2 type transport system permease protein [Bifidobacterium commune]